MVRIEAVVLKLVLLRPNDQKQAQFYCMNTQLMLLWLFCRDRDVLYVVVTQASTCSQLQPANRSIQPQQLKTPVCVVVGAVSATLNGKRHGTWTCERNRKICLCWTFQTICINMEFGLLLFSGFQKTSVQIWFHSAVKEHYWGWALMLKCHLFSEWQVKDSRMDYMKTNQKYFVKTNFVLLSHYF